MPTTSKSGRAAKRVDPAIVSAVAREVTPKLVRALAAAADIETFAVRLTGALPAQDKMGGTPEPGSGNGSAISAAWSIGDRACMLADRLQGLAKLLNNAA